MVSSAMLQAFGLFYFATAAVSSYRLSKEEDWFRYRSCGRVVQQKLYNAAVAQGTDAPWLVQIYNIEEQWNSSGFFISDRHVIVSSNAFFHTESFRWILNDTIADMKTCNNRTMRIPNDKLAQISVHSCSDAKPHEDCMNAGALPVVSGHYIGNCDTNKIPYGFVVLELASPIETISPLCVPKTRIDKVGDQLMAYGAGGRFSPGYPEDQTPGFLPVSVIATCQDHHNLPASWSVCFDHVGACDGDLGGPVVKSVRGQQYGVAVLSNFDCRPNSPRSKHVSVSEFAPQICKLTGICQWMLGEPTNATTKTSELNPTLVE